MFQIVEETTNTRRSCVPGFASADAATRSNDAYSQHKNRFDTDEHVERVEKVANILTAFFGHSPNYYTYRGIGTRRPFESIKMESVGHKLSKMSIAFKNSNLYEPLQAIGNVDICPKNGHLVVRVYC